MRLFKVIFRGKNIPGKDKFINYFLNKQVTIGEEVVIWGANVSDRNPDAAVIFADLDNPYALYDIAENLNYFESKFEPSVVVVIDINLEENERRVSEGELKKFLFYDYINSIGGYSCPLLMKILNIDSIKSVDRFILSLSRAILLPGTAKSLQLTEVDMQATSQSAKYKLCNLIAECCSQARFWNEKVVFKGGATGLVSPGGIKQLLDIQNQNSDLDTRLLQMKRVASFKYSYFFQWAHEAFRGRHPATNKFYGIIDDINFDDAVSVDTGIRRLRKFYNKFIYPSGQELLALGRK